jgi:uncharacterized protein (DUF433 family)
MEEKPTMPLTIHTDPVPLRMDEHGAIRLGDTRILLDVVIEEFANGACPEEIVLGYSTLQLADVYAVIAYYLRHQEEVDNYLREGEIAAERLRQEIEAKQPSRAGLREKLLARRAQMEQAHASPGK